MMGPMQIREISIRNFRGITELSWRPNDSIGLIANRQDFEQDTTWVARATGAATHSTLLAEHSLL